MTYLYRIGIISSAILIFSACGLIPDQNKGDNESKVIVQVNQKELTTKELSKLLNSSMSQADSSDLAELYISQWINSQLLLEKAEDIPSDLLLNIEQRVSEYRNQLLALEVKNQIVNEHIDTLVTSEEIEEYYELNKANFKLNEPIVKCVLVKFRNELSNTQEIENLIRYYKPENKTKIAEFCINSAESCHLNDSIWIEFNNLVYASPFKTWEDPVDNFKSSSFHKVQSENYTFLLKVLDYKDVEAESPLEFQTSMIKNIIINHRKKEILKNYQDELYRVAKENNEIILNY